MDPNAPLMSPDEYDALVRTVIGEAHGQPAEGQTAVAAVALNRLLSGRYGKSMRDVLFAPNQFEPWQTRARELWGIPQGSSAYQSAADAVNTALQGADPTGGATHFFAPNAQAALGRSVPAWAKGEGIRIGGHAFYAPEGKVGTGQTTMAQAKPRTADTGPSDDDLLQLYTAPANKPAAAPQASSPALSGPSDDDLLNAYLRPSQAPQKAEAPVVGGKPFTSNKKEWNAGLAVANGGVLGAGPSLMAAVQATKEKLLHGGDWADLYDQAKGVYAGAREDYKTANPTKNALLEAGGSIPAVVGATVAAAPAAAAALPARAVPFFAGVGTPSAIGGGASAVASGALQGGVAGALTTGLNYDSSKSLPANIGQNALMGAVGGAILNPVGNVVAKGVSAAWPYAPGRDMANKLLGIVGGPELEAATNRMAGNPRLSVMDADPNALSLGQGLAAQPGEPRKVLADAVAQRSASGRQAADAAFDLALGPTPDAKALLDGLKKQAQLKATVGFGEALGKAKPVDLSGVISHIDGELSPGINGITNTQIGATEGQKELAAIRNQLVAPAKPSPYGIKEVAPIRDMEINGVPIKSEDGTRSFAIMKDGKVVAHANATIARDGSVSVQGIKSVEGANSLGPAGVRDAMRAFKEQFPDTPGFIGSRISGARPQDGLQVVQAPQSGGNILTDASRLHDIQSELRVKADTLAKSANGQDRLLAAEIRKVRSGIVDAIDAASGGKYKPAQKQYASDMQVQEAFDKGLSLFKSSANDVENRPEYWRDAVKGMSPDEVEALKQGARVAVNSLVNDTRNWQSAGVDAATRPFNQERLAAVLGDKEAGRLAKAMGDERTISETNRAIMSGSQTQMRREASDAIRVRDKAGASWADAVPFLPEAANIYLGQNNMAGHALAAAALLGSAGRRAYSAAGRASDRTSNLLLARSLAQSGPDAVGAMRQILLNARPENKLLNMGGSMSAPLIPAIDGLYQSAVPAHRR